MIFVALNISLLQMFNITNLLGLFSLAVVVKYLHYLYFQAKYWPPGPRGIPILGNILQLPKLPWYKFTEWKAQYGPIISLDLAGQPMIILNTQKVAGDLLNRRSQIYSDRPRFIMTSEVLGGGMLFPFMPYAERWRRMRRATHDDWNVRASEKYRPLQEAEAARLVTHLLRDPGNWDDHLKRTAASTVLCIVYGWDPIEPKDDPIVERINNFVERLVHAAFPGAHLVEFFPFMKYLPSWMARWKREGLEWHAKDSKMFDGFLFDVKERVQNGNCKPCFSSSLLENQSKFDLTDKETSWLAGTMFAAGSETTATALSVFFLAMMLYPDVMRRAQTEIDEVVGRGRLPNFGDYGELPYIRVVVKEVLRWRPVAPLGIPRRAMESDWYEGYYIPKGALVIPNIWAMNRDPALFPDCDEFRPSRFLDASGKVDETPPDTLSTGHVAYGFGKRICSGMNLANQALFIDIACILWALNIEQPTDNHGNRIVPSKDDCIDKGITMSPALFTCKITARSSDVVAVLEHVKANEAI